MNGKSRWLLKILALCMAVMIGTGMSQISASATAAGTEETGNSSTLAYLALGDSITTGYRLTDASQEGFVVLFANEIGATAMVNAGVTGLTAEALATALGDTTSTDYAAYAASIAAADVITITIGGNDLMEPFYTAVAELYNSQYGASGTKSSGPDIDADTVKTVLANPTLYSTQAETLISILSALDVDAATSMTGYFDTAIATCVANINSITATIKGINPDAVILVANQYNPYQWLGSSYSTLIGLFDTVVTSYNAYLDWNKTSDYSVVDVYSAFYDSADTALTNASVASCDFDFHPNATGHGVIATAMYNAYDVATSQDDTVYTVAIPIELKVEQAESAVAPEGSFTIKALIGYYDETSGLSGLIDVSLAGAAYSVNTVSTDGEGTYSATLTFTCGAELLSFLTDGFYVSLVSGDSTGWTYDDEVYQICYIALDEYGVLSEYTVYSAEDESRESELSSVSFTCIYTGYTLSFETNGGSAIDPVEEPEGTTLSLVDYTPTRSGYAFAGWYTDAELTTLAPEVTLTGDTTVYAAWEELTYTWEVTVELTVNLGGNVEAPAYTFELEILDSGQNTIDVTSLGGTVLSNTVTVSGSGTYTATLSFTGKYQLYSQLENGFYVGVNDKGTPGWEYDDTLYAVSVSFVEGTNELSDVRIDLASTVSTLARTGVYKATSINAVNTATPKARVLSLVRSGAASVRNLAVTYSGSYQTLVYSCTYTGWNLTFETNGGTSIDSVPAADGTTVNPGDYPTSRDGYDFGGWYSDSELTIPVSTVTMTSDTTVYAKWNEIVTQSEDDGTDDSSDDSTDENSEEVIETETVTDSVTAISSESAATGDSSNLIIWIALIVIAGVLIASLTVFQRKNRTNQ